MRAWFMRMVKGIEGRGRGLDVLEEQFVMGVGLILSGCFLGWSSIGDFDITITESYKLR